MSYLIWYLIIGVGFTLLALYNAGGYAKHWSLVRKIRATILSVILWPIVIIDYLFGLWVDHRIGSRIFALFGC